MLLNPLVAVALIVRDEMRRAEMVGVPVVRLVVFLAVRAESFSTVQLAYYPFSSEVYVLGGLSAS